MHCKNLMISLCILATSNVVIPITELHAIELDQGDGLARRITDATV